MTRGTCFVEKESQQDVRLNEEEVVALFINMMAFGGDWKAHLNFLDQLDETLPWRADQIPLVKEMEQKDRVHGIQTRLSSQD